MTSDVSHAEHHHDEDGKDIFGFWIYIMSDCVLFATLFAAFVVLHNNTYGQPALKEFISLPYVFAESMFLLASNFSFGLAILSLYRGLKKQLFFWLVATFVLGLGFVGMELNEFIHLTMEGHGWHTSGAMTGFFTLVGTHGLHVSIGLFWMLIMMTQILKFSLAPMIKRRLTYLGLFWNFLDIVWIFVFTVVYLMGAI